MRHRPLDPQKRKNPLVFHWFCDFYASGQNRSFGPFWASWRLRSWPRFIDACWFPKIINSQLILPKMRFMTTFFGLKLAQNRVCSSMQKTPMAAVKLTFAFLSILKSIEIWCFARGATRAARASIRPHLGLKSGLPECHLDPSWRSNRLSCLSIACRSSYLSFVVAIIKSNLYYCMSFTSSLFVTTIFNSNLSCCMLFVFAVAIIANMLVRFGLHHHVLRRTAVAFAVLKTILNAAYHAGYLAGNPPEHRRRLT